MTSVIERMGRSEELPCSTCHERSATVIVDFGGRPTAMCCTCIASWRAHCVSPFVPRDAGKEQEP